MRRPAYHGLRIGAPMAYRANPIVLGRKFCAECGRWRPVHDFSPAKRRGGGLCSYCRACANRKARAWYHAAHPPEWWELRREYSRIYQQAKRREVGIPEAKRNGHAPRGRRDFLPVEPIVAELRFWDGTFEGLARASGVPARTIYRLRHGESVRVEAGVADRLAHALGVPLAIVYRGER